LFFRVSELQTALEEASKHSEQAEAEAALAGESEKMQAFVEQTASEGEVAQAEARLSMIEAMVNGKRGESAALEAQYEAAAAAVTDAKAAAQEKVCCETKRRIGLVMC
jgi:hypothetical protein